MSLLRSSKRDWVLATGVFRAGNIIGSDGLHRDQLHHDRTVHRTGRSRSASPVPLVHLRLSPTQSIRFCRFQWYRGRLTVFCTHAPRLNDGVRAEDAVPAAARSSPLEEELQIHALCNETRGYHAGRGLDRFHDESDLAYGEQSGQNWSVAGNCLASVNVVDLVGEAYTSADTTRPLAERLIDALEAGDEAGGDGRDNEARSAAIFVADPTAGLANEWYNVTRIDASKTPLVDLRKQYELAKSFYETKSKEW